MPAECRSCFYFLGVNMRACKTVFILLIIFSISACQLFLGLDPDGSPKGIFDRIWTDFNETYALFDVKGIDWNKVYAEYSPQIYSGMSEYELFRKCSQMLNTLKDYHVGLLSPFGYSLYLSYNDINYNAAEVFPIINLYSVQMNYLKDKGNMSSDGMFLYGTFKSNENIGYIYLLNFWDNSDAELDIVQNWVKEIDNILKSLKNTDALVLDIRNNAGGTGSNMDYIASRFVSKQKNYAISRTKNGPGRNDFSAPVTWTVKPSSSAYTKPIVMLTNERTISAGEWFALALKTQSHITHAGKPTCGALSARVMRPLINGWKYSMSVQKVTDINGKSYEGEGISPNKEHLVDDFNFSGDEQLEYSIDLAAGLAGKKRQ